MKRIFVEVAAAGVACLVIAGLHADVATLRKSATDAHAELARLKSQKPVVDEELSSRLERQASELASVRLDIASVANRVATVGMRAEEEAREARKHAAEAVGQSNTLSKAVETTQKLVAQQKAELSTHAQRLERNMLHQLAELNELRRGDARPDARIMTRDMLLPTVQLSGAETVGSGTVIACNKVKDGWESWILTANHVVRNILADEPNIAKTGIVVTIYGDKKTERRCDVVARNPGFDLALCRVRGRKRITHVAALATENDARTMELWRTVFAVGCPLGNDPLPTGGFVSSLANEVRGTKYWMINAPTYYGNSGGGIYDGESRKLIAVFSKIYTHGSTRPIVVPHMGLAVPMTLVYPWLRKAGYGKLIPVDQPELAAPAKD